MALNPIRFTAEVNEQFLKYQFTTFPLTDPDLAGQARSLLRGHVGNSPLFKGPYVSLSKSFKLGRNLEDLAESGLVHPALPGLTEYTTMFAHQDATLSEVMAGNHCLVATGTGSGKTEAFLYPILDHCLKLRDANAPEGVVAVLVYPMNALAIDQLNRLRQMLAGSGISFGMYVGTTAADEGELGKLGNIVRVKPGEGRNEFDRQRKKYRDQERVIISPAEERLTEKELAEHPPRLLLTNVNQLELLLTRGKDLGMFIDAPLKFLVFDEAHTYSGAVGAEVGCLIRRLRAFCGKSANEVICVATSATMTDPETGEDAGVEFAHRLFGINRERIKLVREEYQSEEFPNGRSIPEVPSGDVILLLDRILQSLESEDEPAIREAVAELTGKPLSTRAPWPEMLYEHLKANEYVYAIYHGLERPLYLPDALQRISILIGRGGFVGGEMAQAELLCYLAFGAAAEKGGNPLLRPKVHYFVKGLEGAVTTFVDSSIEGSAELFLSLSAAQQKHPIEGAACLPILVCKNCGQHYFESRFANFVFDDGEPSGGQAEGENVIWEPANDPDGSRVVLTNRFVSEIDDESGIASDKLDRKRTEVFFCRFCGTLHRLGGSCQGPKCKRAKDLVPLWLIATTDSGKLMTCPSCGQKGRQTGERVQEPIKPLRAVTVADVHIMAQNMINALNVEQQKLIVFSDNRQDAAFQAGWMQDHARRYRLRHLIYDFLRDKESPSSLTDIQEHLMRLFREDRNLGMGLAPEVYVDRGDEAFGRGLEEDLRYFLRIALVREWATGFKQKESLETWGVSRVVYAGIEATAPWVAEWANRLGLAPEELSDGISSLLDSFRRNRYLYDERAPIFSRYWHESDYEIQAGFLPFFDFPPKALKERREEGDNQSYVTGFRSARSQTGVENFVGKWGVKKEIQSEFLDALWEFLTHTSMSLVPVTLVGNKGRALPGIKGVAYQLSSAKIGIVTQRSRYKCDTCQRVHSRSTPNMACTAIHCKGTLKQELPPADDYNVALLDLPFSMLAAEEHTAQVPGRIREKIEEEFKKPNGRINCLVATPTLELGVDIGSLDMVLMRNVPPKPSNYWQRAGRAGRRHRMAVIYTYCRRSNHDTYFFESPTRMLDGVIEAPRFNLRNEVMLKKHVHAAVISEMIRLTRIEQSQSGLPASDVEELNRIRHEVLPDYIVGYLFHEGRLYRDRPYSVASLSLLTSKHRERFLGAVRAAFATNWPERDSDLVTHEALGLYIDDMAEALQAVIDRLHARMVWARTTLDRLLDAQKRGLLEPEEERLMSRCRRYLKQLAERQISTYVLRVLAVEGFLPGYGSYDAGIRAFATRRLSRSEGKPDFELSRAAAMAVREFVPGNLIYANSGRFKVALFHFPVGEEQSSAEQYLIELAKERITEASSRKPDDVQYGGQAIPQITGMPISDVDVSYVSRISDDEENRFQLPVTILGYLRKAHRGGFAYSAGAKTFQHRFAQHMRLVNVGPADKVRSGELGFPICTVCGAARSPYASDRDLQHFAVTHKERCGKAPGKIALSADARVDTLIFGDLESREVAVNLGIAIRLGAAQVLEMDLEDLQILPLVRSDDRHGLALFDPMPGGSGLLQQIIDRWLETLAAATSLVNDCPDACERSCYRCMRTYRNVFYHDLLDRKKTLEILSEYGSKAQLEHDIPAVEEERTASVSSPTNFGEAELGVMLERAGFPPFEHQHAISIGPPYGTTTPDLYHEDPTTGVQVAIYLDGLSRGIHGNAETAKVDRVIREQLESDGVDVIEIASSDLPDLEAMRRHFKRIAVKLRRPDLRDR